VLYTSDLRVSLCNIKRAYLNTFSLSIPQTAHRKAIFLIFIGAVAIAVIIGHIPVPGTVGTGLGRTPPVTIVANVAEISIVATAASRKSCKTTAVGCAGVDGPMGRAGFFQLAAGNTSTAQVGCQCCPFGIAWYMPASGAEFTGINCVPVIQGSISTFIIFIVVIPTVTRGIKVFPGSIVCY